MTIKRNLGKLIALRRLDMGLTQTELGQKINLSRSHLARIELGGSAPPLEIILQLNEIFNFSLLENDLIKSGKEITEKDYVSYKLKLLKASKAVVTDKFTNLPGGKLLMMIDLVEPYAEAGYLNHIYDSSFSDEMPKHFIVVDTEHKGDYLAWRVRGDSMTDGTLSSIVHGAIVTGRNVKKDQWKHKFHTKDWKNFIIVEKERIVLKEVVHHDGKKGTITLRSLNPDKEDHPDRIVYLDELIAIYRVVRVTTGE